MSDDDQSTEIERHMALAFFASAYADQAEECGQPMRGEIMDQLPEDIDPAALHAARTLRMDMERANGANIVTILGYVSERAAGDREPTAEFFGHYSAMQAMGHGVGLADAFGSAAHDLVRVPSCEFGSHSLQNDYFTSAEG